MSQLSNPLMDFENTAIPVCFSLGNVASKSNYNTVYPKNRTESPDHEPRLPGSWDAPAVEIPHTSLSVPSLFLCPLLDCGWILAKERGASSGRRLYSGVWADFSGGHRGSEAPVSSGLREAKLRWGPRPEPHLFLTALSRYRCSSMNTDSFCPLLRRERGGLPVFSPVVFGKV